MQGWKEGETDDRGLLVIVGGESTWCGKLTCILTFRTHIQYMALIPQLSKHAFSVEVLCYMFFLHVL